MGNSKILHAILCLHFARHCNFWCSFSYVRGRLSTRDYPRSVDGATLRIYPWPTPLPRISSYTRSYFRTSHSTAIYRKLLLSKLFDHHDDSVR